MTIEGDFTATLNELPTKGRATLERRQFGADLPRDEFFRRAATISGQCLSDQDEPVLMDLK